MSEENAGGLLERGSPVSHCNRSFIVGGGKSLEGFDFHRLKNETTIGINFAFKFFEPTILIWSDRDVYLPHKKEIDVLKSKKFCYKNVHHPSMKDVSFYDLSDTFNGKEGLQKGLFGGSGDRLTGILAISLALALGHSPVYLLGFDGGVVNSGLHFHSYSRNRDSFTRHNKDYEKFKNELIINCSMDSQIETFHKIPITEVLGC